MQHMRLMTCLISQLRKKQCADAMLYITVTTPPLTTDLMQLNEESSGDLFGEDWTQRQLVHHALEVVRDQGQIAAQLLSGGLDHLRDTVGLLAAHLLLPCPLQVWHDYHLALTDAEPVLLWPRLYLLFLTIDGSKPSSESDQRHRQLNDLCLLFTLKGKTVKDRSVKEVKEKVFLGELVDVCVGGGESEFAHNLFGLVVVDMNRVGDLRPHQDHSSTEDKQISGDAHLTIADLLDFSIGAADSFDQSVHPDTIEAVFWQQFHQHILIFDGDVLLQASLRVKFPSNSVLISDNEDEMRFFFDGLAVDLAVHYKLISRHLISDKQLSAIDVATQLPHFETVSVVDYNEFSLTIDPVAAAVAHFMLIIPFELSCLQLVEAEICGQASTYQITTQSLQCKDIVTLASNMLAYLPFLVHQPHHTHLGVRTSEVDTLSLLVYLDGQDWSLVLTEGLDVRKQFPIIYMKTAFVVSNKHPLSWDNLACSKSGLLIGHLHLLTETNDGSFSVQVIGSTRLRQELIGEVILVQMPSDGLLFVEGVDSLSCNSD